MSPTTRRIHEMSFQVVDCDIPADMTVAQYRRSSAAATSESSRGRGRLGRRRLRRANRG